MRLCLFYKMKCNTSEDLKNHWDRHDTLAKLTNEELPELLFGTFQEFEYKFICVSIEQHENGEIPDDIDVDQWIID